MTWQVVFLHSAEQDLKALQTYLVKRFGQAVWQESYQGIKERVNTLKSFPLSGSIPEELESLHFNHYRQVISGMNRIIYEIRQDTIYIHIVCDTRKDMKSLLTRRLLRST